MKHQTVIKLIMKRRKITRRGVAAKFGIKDQQGVNTLFNGVSQDASCINRVVTMLDALDYQLVFQPKGDGTVPERCYRIRLSDYEGEE